MSRIGKLPIPIPTGITVQVNNGTVTVKGTKGELTFTHHPRIKVQTAENRIIVERSSSEKNDKALHGLTRTLISNMIEGVSKGFERKLEINGVGYRAQTQGKKLVLSLGFSHPIEIELPGDIAAEIDKEKKNIIILTGSDKQLLSETAAKIRGLRPPEPYKGKGIKYMEEHIQRKAGKAAGAKEGK